MLGCRKRWTMAAALVALAGCDISFPDEFLVEDLRILNIRADPPEVPIFVADGSLMLDPMNLPTPAITPVRVTALVAHPDLDATFEYDWVRCTPGLSSIPCPTAERERLDDTPSDQLEFSPVRILVDEILDEGPMGIGQALAQDPRDLLSGLYAHVNLEVRVGSADTEVDTTALEGTKRIVVFEPRVVATTVQEARNLMGVPNEQLAGLDLPSLCTNATEERVGEILGFLSARPVNEAPRHEGFVFSRLGTGAVTSSRSIGVDEVIELAPSQRVELRGMANEDAIEAYRVIDGNCELVDFEETVSFSWFTTGGSFSRQVTTNDVPATVYTAPNSSDLTADRTRVRVWSVVRDGRGGSDHRFFEFDVIR